MYYLCTWFAMYTGSFTRSTEWLRRSLGLPTLAFPRTPCDLTLIPLMDKLALSCLLSCVRPVSLALLASFHLYSKICSSHFHIYHCPLSCLCSSHLSCCSYSHLNYVYVRPRSTLAVGQSTCNIDPLDITHTLANCRFDRPLDLLLMG